jgi:hypothetical protein
MSREKKFTEGPWKSGFRIKGINGGTTIRDSKDRKIAEVIAEEIPVREANKNAHLISAVHELLKELESHCDACMLRNKWDNGCKGCLTKRAIKKAYGESQ